MKAKPLGCAALSRLAVLAGCAVSLSSCHELLRVHVRRRRSAGARAATPWARGPRRLRLPARSSGRADGELAARATLKHGFVKSTIRNARFRGTFTARTAGGARGALRRGVGRAGSPRCATAATRRSG